jgi:hypothetical protein
MDISSQLTDVEIIDYDVQAFPFRAWFSDVLGTEHLEILHELHRVTAENIAEHVKSLQEFCEERVLGLQRLVDTFIESIVAARFGRLVGRQEVPTIRFHFAMPGPEFEAERKALLDLEPTTFLAKYYLDGHRIGMFHRDRDYGLPSGTVNLWIPVTNVWGANALWLGGRGIRPKDSRPVSLQHGQALLFDGANRWHGVVWNTSDTTRVSFDLRFRPESTWQAI